MVTVMPYELVAALQVTDAERYALYRNEIRPLLARAAAEFRFDLEVSRVIRPVGQPGFNRLFVLAFPDRAAKEAFFADPAYAEVRTRHFPHCVAVFVAIAEYDTQGGLDADRH